MSDASSTTYLVVEAGSHEGQRINLTGARMTVGRLPTCEVRFDDPYLSRTHAALWQQGGVDYVEDLGSAGGTFVNGEAITEPRRLHAGDRIAFAELRLRYGTGEGAPAGVRYDIGDQRAHAINNVGRDQYVQQVIQQRENFFREIAAAKTKARGLIWTGVVVFLVGLAVAAFGWYTYYGQILDLSAASSMPTKDDFSGLLVFALGGLVNLVGVLLIIVGIVLHIVATARRRRVDRELPPPQFMR
ncbi:FHA domain-containing protein [Streptomyces sp. SID13031]|uniref:FHA domain-containing protein n=1 Tax=Streptomyces sp. SID13031 TaxID=2706046 RepID=UPI0013C5533E|nr:FHA domain-containing protein [Streptomyces sp. SID13031]NEA30716.1 FHA domain-containing protein [Streptomyces sp. SID13031]